MPIRVILYMLVASRLNYIFVPIFRYNYSGLLLLFFFEEKGYYCNLVGILKSPCNYSRFYKSQNRKSFLFRKGPQA